MPPKLGVHMSIAGGVDRAVSRARAAGCEALQVFTKSNSQWRARPLDEGEIERFRDGVAEAGLPVIAHASYLINLGSPDDALWSKSRDALEVELLRCEALGIGSLVLHPGSHVGSGEQLATGRIARAIDEIHARHPRLTSQILLENTAGQGTNLGHEFSQLRDILALVGDAQRVGVCVDTAHTFAAGYELDSAAAWDATWNELDRCVGWNSVRAVHVNDSKTAGGSRVDRHAEIGQGQIPMIAFVLLMNDDRFDGLPALLETPKTEAGHEDEQNLAVLRALVGRKRAPSAVDVERWRAQAKQAVLESAEKPSRPAKPRAKSAAKKTERRGSGRGARAR